MQRIKLIRHPFKNHFETTVFQGALKVKYELASRKYGCLGNKLSVEWALSCVDVYGPRLFATPYLELDRFHGC